MGAEEPTAEDEGIPGGADHLVPSARQSEYQAEAAELLAGSAARRKRRGTTASGLPAPDPDTQQPSIRLTFPPRPGSTRPPAKD
jgi:hypothetical protein